MMLRKISEWFYMRKVSKPEDKKAFWVTPLPHLLGDQILAILDMIDDEILRSFRYGLKISREHVFKEKAAVLSILNKMGGWRSIPKRCDFDKVMKIFSEAMGEIMKEESEFYFQKCKKEGRVKTAYACHLEAVRERILNAIYNGQLPFTEKQKEKEEN